MCPAFEPSAESAPGLELQSVVSWTTKTIPAELPGQVYAILGENCFQRFVDFSKWPDGWDHGSGDAIGWRTYENLLNFLDSARFRTSHPPSLFLTNEGYLEISWDGKDGAELSVTISPAGGHFFRSSDGSEQDYPPERLRELGDVSKSLTI